MDTDPNLALALISVVVGLGTALVTIVVGWRTRPRRPPRGEFTDELGVETPAVVDLLTDDFSVTTASVPATVLDLAVRRWLTIEEVAGGHVLIRLRRRDPLDDQLAPFESRVLNHLRELAVDGVVPADAMTTGAAEASKRWWRAFRREVISDAQERGLCRDRWPRQAVTLLTTGVLATGGALWLADRLGDEADTGAGPDSSGWLWGVALVLAIATGGWLLSLSHRDLQRDTDAGLEAASRWLGVREYLSSVGDFSDKTAASVTLWERHLAYAVAMDLAPVALAQLPLGAEDHRHCWSRATGHWRRVVVRYPFLRPGYGQHPLVAALGALAAGVVATIVAAFVLRVLRGEVAMIEDLPSGATRIVESVAMALGISAVLVVGWNLLKLLAALGDLAQVDTVEGLLLRRRVRRGLVGLHEEADQSTQDGSRAKPRYFCALDAGGASTVTAWRVREALYRDVHQGGRYRARVTRRLCYVRSLEPLVVDTSEPSA